MRLRLLFKLCLGAGLASAFPLLASGATITATWLGGSGSWTNANWDIAGFPNDNVSDVFIARVDGGSGGSASPVLLNIDAELSGLEVDSGDSVTILNGRDLTLSGSLVNDGDISISASGQTTNLFIDGPTSLSGTGTVTMSNTFFNSIAAVGTASPSVSVASGAAQTFSGLGNLLVDVANAGTLRADGSGTVVRVAGAQMSNSGLLEATNGGAFQIQNGARVVGGTLDSSGGGEFRSGGGSTLAVLDGVTNNGQVRVLNGTNLGLAGSVVNDGDIALGATGSATNLFIEGATTLDGTGSVTMSGTFFNSIGGVSGTSPSLTVAAGATQTLNGIGNWLVDTENQGTLRADGTGTIVRFSGAQVTNPGVLEAVNDGAFQFQNGTRVTGGTLDSSAGGEFQSASGSNHAVLEDVVHTGQLRLFNGHNLGLAGTIVNDGDIAFGATGSTTSLLIEGSTTLEGTGSFSMTNTFFNRIIGDTGTSPNLTVASDATQTFGGLSYVLVDIANEGTLRAEGTGTAVRLSGAQVANAGVLETVNGGAFQFQNGTRVTGGTLDSSTGGEFQSASGGTLAVLEDVTHNGQLRIFNGHALGLAGMIVNNGDIALDATGSITSLFIEGPTALDGAGSITLNNNVARNLIQGVSGSAPSLVQGEDHRIQGEGTIAMDLTNNGILAPGSGTGTLRITGNLDMGDASELSIELAAPGNADFLDARSTVELDGVLSLSFLAGFTDVVGPGDIFTILDADGGLSGEFANVVPGGRLATAGGSFLVNYGLTSAFDPDSVVLSEFSVVPEPGTLLLGLVATLTVWSRKRALGGRRHRLASW